MVYGEQVMNFNDALKILVLFIRIEIRKTGPLAFSFCLYAF